MSKEIEAVNRARHLEAEDLIRGIVADSVNRGISTARRTHAAYTIGLSINEDLKLKKRKGKDKQQRKKLYTICWSCEGHVTSMSTITSTITAVLLVP